MNIKYFRVLILFEKKLDMNNITASYFYYLVFNRFFVDSIDVMDVKHQKSVYFHVLKVSLSYLPNHILRISLGIDKGY